MATYIPQKAEDAASADGDLGVPILAVQKATPANTAGTDGDYEFLQMSAGRVWTSAKIDTALPAGTNAIGKLAANDGVDIGDVTVNNAAGASAVNIQDGGNVITVDGTVGVSGSVAVTGPLTNTELRASAVPVSVASLPLPSGAATEATLATRLSESDFDTKVGSLTETAPTGDTDSSGLNGRLQRIAQRLTTLIGTVATETTLAAAAASLNTMDDWDESDRAKVNPIVGQAGIQGGAGTSSANTTRVAIATDANAVSVSSLPLPSGAATEATLSAINGKLVTAKTADYDTGAGTDTVQMMGIALPKSGGAVAGGTSTDPVRTDPTGTTTQPISAASLPLPSGAATAAAQTDKSQFTKVTDGTDTLLISAAGSAQVTLDAETTKVIGTIRNLGNAGAILDGVNTAATAPANGILGLGIYNSTEPSPTTGQSVGIQLDSKGRQRQVIMDAAGNTRGANVDANSNLGVVLAAETTKVLGVTRTADGAGNLLTSNSTTFTAKFGLDVNMLGTLGTAFSTAGKVDVKGADGDVFVRQATAANLNAQVVGAAASGASASGNPVSTGALAATSLPTAVSNAQMVRPMADVFGRTVVIPQAPRDLVDDEILTITASTAVQSFTKSAASTFYDITALIIENKSASAGTEVIIYNNDGTTERCRIYVPAQDTRGVVFQVPLKAAGSNVVWKAKTVTSVTSVYITAQYVLNK